ncbi:MAG: GNAT family N-acetyltransferase [Tannerella sp.]|jgi:GNAT superfamily N-acetyltransferase|nr:GNAT family N-acetyltransferase [Tannerella sp.]
MEYHSITHAALDNKLLVGIRDIYETSFPADERRHFDDVVRIAGIKPAFCGDIYTEDRNVVGFILSWRFSFFRYAEHFAVRRDMRGKGYGRTIFADFMKRAGPSVVLEVQRPEDETSRRRIRFYERLGLIYSSAPYLQPPYSPDKHPVPLSLMNSGFDLDKRFDEVRNTLYREVYGVKQVSG